METSNPETVIEVAAAAAAAVNTAFFRTVQTAPLAKPLVIGETAKVVAPAAAVAVTHIIKPSGSLMQVPAKIPEASDATDNEFAPRAAAADVVIDTRPKSSTVPDASAVGREVTAIEVAPVAASELVAIVLSVPL